MVNIVLGIAVMLASVHTVAASSAQVRQLERLALLLTGELPSARQRADFVAGTKTLPEIAEELRDSEAFERQLAYFYQEKLNITTPVNIADIYALVISNDGRKLSRAQVHLDRNLDPDYLRRVAAAITVEPGRIMAKNVRSAKNYAEILTTSQGVVNGVYLHFLQNYGNVIHKSFFQDGDKVLAKTNVLNSYPNLHSMRLERDDPTFHWIERGGEQHAGVLTTIAFHRATNGRRAKANKLRSALLCREFIDPPAAVPDTEDRRRLEERSYCGGCHQYLEPLAAFFYRWPDTGNDNNYFYNHVRNSRASYYIDTACGEDCRAEGDGVQALAKILITHQDQAFKKCAIQHAYEFLTRQRLPAGMALIPELLQVYDHSGGKIWAVMQAIMNMDFFRNSSDGTR